MLAPRLFWIDQPWNRSGRLAISARPSADWLAEDIQNWRESGIGAVISLLMPDEEEALGLAAEEQYAKENGITFLPFPIQDRSVPGRNAQPLRLLDRIDAELTEGKNVLVHCRGGVGRSGMIAAAVLMRQQKLSAEDAMERWTNIRGVQVPETPGQQVWLQDLERELRTPRAPIGRR